MTQSFTASVRGWNERQKAATKTIIRETIQDIGEIMTRRVDGVTTGAPFKYGFTPVVSGELIASVIVQIDGATVARGSESAKMPPDFTAALAGFEVGQRVLVGFTAPYARKIEYGFQIASDDDTDYAGDVDVPGRFMMAQAVQQFVTLIHANAALF